MIGIYKIISPSGKIYIGQSINIERRWKDYKSMLKNRIGPKLYNSLLKHGYDNHKFEIIEEYLIEQLDEKETYWKQYYLEQHNKDFMLFCELYDRGSGPKSEETKQKIGLANTGKKRSEETKQKISKAQLGNSYALGNKLTDEQKNKISQAKKGHSCYNIDFKRKISKANTGKKRSEEQRKKHSDIRKNVPRNKRIYNTLVLDEIKEKYIYMSTPQLSEYFNVSVKVMRNFLKNNNIFEFRKNK